MAKGAVGAGVADPLPQDPHGESVPPGDGSGDGPARPSGGPDGAPAGPGRGSRDELHSAADPGTGDQRQARKSVRIALLVVVIALLTAEVIVGAPRLVVAFSQLRTPHWAWLAAAVAVEVASMGWYARMQRRLLRSAGTRISMGRHIALAYAAHSLSVTLPGGPLFSTRYNFAQMRRYGASAAVASWCIALSGILSSTALVAIGTVAAVVAGGTGNWWALSGYLGAALGLAFGVRALARRPQRVVRLAGAVLAVVNRIRRRPRDQGIGRVVNLISQLAAVRIGARDLSAAALFAVLNWLLDAVCLWMCCQAVDAGGIRTTELIMAYCAGMAAASIPLVPGNVGVVDGALIVGLVAGGVGTGSAIAAVLCSRVISLGFIIGAGWVFWLLVRRRQRARARVEQALTDRALADAVGAERVGARDVREDVPAGGVGGVEGTRVEGAPAGGVGELAAGG